MMFTKGNKNSQKILNLEMSEDYSLENYFVTKSNKNAFESIQNQVLGINPYINILIILGPKSSGKTFLANIALSLNGILIKEMADLSNDKINIVDDANLYEEEKIFHIFNKCVECNNRLILIADQNWKIKLNDLKSRINSIKCSRIVEPDDELVEIILSREFSKRSLVVSKEVVSYLIPRVSRNFAEIQKTVDELDKYCLETKKNLNIKSVSMFYNSFIAR